MPYGKKSPAKMGHKDSAMKMGHKDSAMKMGHDSPTKNHHYGKRKGESVKQEKYNLLHDNPVGFYYCSITYFIYRHYCYESISPSDKITKYHTRSTK